MGTTLLRWLGSRPVLPAACLLSALALVGFGCGGPRRAAAPPSPPSGAGFPVVLTDAQGERVQVPGAPRRIVSLAPTVTEILFAIGVGDRVVAAADPADYPPGAARLPRLGGWFTPSAEKTLAAEPDLVIGSRGNPPEFLASLRKAGRTVFTVDPRTLDDILAAIRDIGRATGAGEAADAVVGRAQARLRAVADRIADVPQSKRPQAFMVIGVSPVWTAGSGTFQDDAIRAAGGRNVASSLKGFRPFSTESLLAADPDFLLVSTMDGDPEQMKRDVLSDPALKRLPAAREGRFVVLEANHIMRPGPRIVEAVEAMARAFYPDRFRPATSPSRGAVNPQARRVR